MKNTLEKNLNCQDLFNDKGYKNNIPAIINLFMNMAGEHGTELGVGFDNLIKSGLIWVISKNKIHINRLPDSNGTLTAITWPTDPGKIRCNRYYKAYDEKGEIAVGKSEWAIVEVATGKPHKIEELYPKGIEMLKSTVCDSPFSRPDTNFLECEEIARYIVGSEDIDANNHMNNVAYIRAVLNRLPDDLFEGFTITDVEAMYRAQCYEGENLSFKLRKINQTYEIGVIKEDGTTSTIIILTYA